MENKGEIKRDEHSTDTLQPNSNKLHEIKRTPSREEIPKPEVPKSPTIASKEVITRKFKIY